MDKKLLRDYFIELLGSFLFVLTAAGVTCVNMMALPAGQAAGTTPLSLHQPGLLGAAVAQGLVWAVVPALTAPVTGGYLNPAVTIMLWLSSRVPTIRASWLLGAQFLGGLLAGLCLRVTFDLELLRSAQFGAPHLNPLAYPGLPTSSIWAGAGIELVLTFLLVFAMEKPGFSCTASGRGSDQGWSMAPLTAADLLPLEEYASRRREFFEAHRRYLDRCRRVRIGPRLTLVFENRQTLWYRVQEVVRIARLASAGEVQQELNLYNRLLPGKDLLQAALLIEIADESRFTQELAHWRELRGDQLRLWIGAISFPATLVTNRPQDLCVGTAHWVQLHIAPAFRLSLADFDLPAHMAFDNGRYQHESDTLSDELRQSLLDDLELSDRDDNRRAS